jgi:hypothetical protein
MQHYTRNTLEVREWCRKCNKATMHRVDAPKLGPCLECLKRLETTAAEVNEPAIEQRGLFES